MRKVLFIAFLLFVVGIISAQSYVVKATTDSLEYLVGDYINYKITVDAPKNTDVYVPPFADSLKSLHFLRKGKTETEGKRKVFHYVLAGYDSLEATIPKIPVVLKNKETNKTDTILTNEVKLFVNTVKIDTTKDIRDIKKVLEIPYDWKTVLLYVAILLLLLAVAYFLYKKFGKKKTTEEKKTIKVVLPPHKIAYKKLSELEAAKLWQQGKIKEYHSKITEIIREYFEGRYGFNSLEMTSAETLNELRKRNVSLEAIQTVEQFLTNADMVKFAKFQPMPTVNENMMKEAYKIVELTKPQEETQTEERNV